MSARLPALLLIALLAMVACESPTGATGDAVDVTGSWKFEASQTGSALRIDGTLVLAEQEGSAFTGSLQIREVDAQGIARIRSGLVTGQMLDGMTMDFDALLDDAARRHVGTLRGDSVSGSWLQAEGSASINGRFTATRTSP